MNSLSIYWFDFFSIPRVQKKFVHFGLLLYTITSLKLKRAFRFDLTWVREKPIMVAILSGSRKFLIWAGLLNECPVLFSKFKVPTLFINCFCMFIMLQFFASLIAFAYQQRIAIENITINTYMSIEFACMILIYSDFVQNKLLVQYVFEILRNMVLKSE